MKKLERKDVHRGGAETLRKSFIVGDAINVGAKKIYGKFFHVSGAGVKHMDVLHNLFARPCSYVTPSVNKFAPTFSALPTINGFSQRLCASAVKL